MPDLSSVAREAAEAEGLRRIPESPMAFHGGIVVDMAKFEAWIGGEGHGSDS